MEQLPRPTSGRIAGEAEQDQLGHDLLANLHDGYEATSFEDYPGARGIPVERLRVGDFEADQANHALAIAQCWLFFGLLESVLRTRIPASRFVEDKGQCKAVLSTRDLPEYVEAWRRNVEGLDTAAKDEWRRDIGSIFRTAVHFFTGFAVTGSATFPPNAEDYMNVPAVLLEVLQWARSDVFGEIIEGEPLPANFSAAQVKRLQEKGWCPCTIQDIASTFQSPSVFSYAVSLANHEAVLKGGHEGCNGNICEQMIIDPATYKPHHVDQNCRCEHLIPDLWLLYAIIKVDGIVLIELSETGDLVTTPYRRGSETPFVAISHVWSQGRGSWAEQGLPKCQVHALVDAASAAYCQTLGTNIPRVAIWIDALCIPKSPEFRAQAVGLISETFWAADAVLVVDSGILEVKLSDSLQEQLFLIFISGWMQRLWTLVEGLRARLRLVFWVSDGFLDASTFAGDEAMALKGKDVVSTEMLGWFAQLLITSMSPASMANLLPHMARRRTSWAEDEVVAIADFFGLDTASYIPLNREERMQKFLIEHNQCRVESSLLFFGGFKLRTPNFTWAPQSFLRMQEAPVLFRLKGGYDEEMAIITNDGLVSKYHYLHLQNRWEIETKSIRTSNGRPVLLRDNTLHETFTAIPAKLWDEEAEEQPSELAPDFILLSRRVQPQEEFLGVAAKQLDAIEGEDGIDAFVVSRLFDVHIFNDEPFKSTNHSEPVVSIGSGDAIFNIR